VASKEKKNRSCKMWH